MKMRDNPAGSSKRSTGEIYRKYAHFSGMAFQMVILIAGGTYGGIKLDEKIGTLPAFTIAGSLLAIAISIYFVYKSVKNIQDKP